VQGNISILDIAKIAGVSKSTVSRVLNGQHEVSANTRERVQTAIRKNTYIPNNSARNLSSNSTQTIVTVVSGITNPVFARMIPVIQTELEKKQYTMILHDHDPELDVVDVAISLYKEKRPKGLLFLGGKFENGRERLRRLNTPIMLVTRTIYSETDRSWFSSIMVDDELEGYKIGQYICGSGHKQIATIGISHRRIQGFERALNEHGLSAAKMRMVRDIPFSLETGYLTAKKLLETGSYSCIFCFSDTIAIGAIKAIREKGFSIPGDISVVGFDGIEMGEYTYPTLASVRQPVDKLAKQGVSALFGMIDSDEPNTHVILPAAFKEGGSFRSLVE
jgi:LacI family transcriptional regulator